MGIRSLVTLLITFFGIRMSFIDAYYGLIAYSFWSYTFPEKVTWGLLPLTGLSYVTGLVLVLTTLIQKKKLFNASYDNTAIIAFWFLSLISVITAGADDLAVTQFIYFSRVILITLFITLLVDDMKRFTIYLWAMVIFIGCVAAQAGFRGVISVHSGGAKSGYAGVIGERNFTAVTLCSSIPIIYYMARTQYNKHIKLVLYGIFFGVVFAIYLTYSRAGFIGLCVFGLLLIASTKRKVLAFFMALLAILFFLSPMMPEKYRSRMESINDIDIGKKDTDMSAVGRIIAWRSAIEMIKSSPITGVGFYATERRMVDFPDPVTGIIQTGKAIHNSFLQVGACIGLPALMLYIIIFILAFLKLRRIKKKAADEIINNDEIWNYASMLQASFVGFFTTAFFVNAAFIDISWHLLALTLALEQIAFRKEPESQIA